MGIIPKLVTLKLIFWPFFAYVKIKGKPKSAK